MHHLALVPNGQPLVKPVRPMHPRYVREQIVPRFQALSDDQYLAGPIGILNTAARCSYVLDQQAILWCIEWSPGRS
jgi:hypothetical protein